MQEKRWNKASKKEESHNRKKERAALHAGVERDYSSSPA
jgi:hypothetical protein